jgi:hypothetical protein
VRKVTRRRVVAAIIAVLLATMFFLIRDWTTVDRCLDAGGRWDAEAEECDFGD